jgi:hypothetical protein
MGRCGAKSMMPRHAKFPLKTDPRPSIANGLYHVTLENMPLTLKLPLALAEFDEGAFQPGEPADHRVDDVAFQDVVINGRPLAREDVTTNAFVRNVTVQP